MHFNRSLVNLYIILQQKWHPLHHKTSVGRVLLVGHPGVLTATLSQMNMFISGMMLRHCVNSMQDLNSKEH